MPDHSLLVVALLFLAVGALYSSIGHAGSTGYIAIMTLLGIQVESLRPAVLVLNTIVASIAFVQFFREGHFCWRLFWPFSCASIPLAYLGGRIGLAPVILSLVLGALLLVTAVRMFATTAVPPPRTTRQPPTPLAVVVGGVIGFVSGLTGTGGGVLLGPCILLFKWADPKKTAGASALFSLGNSLAGVAGIAMYAWDPPPHLLSWAGAAALGGVLGATFGSRVATHKTLRVLLSAVLAIAGVKLLLT